MASAGRQTPQSVLGEGPSNFSFPTDLTQLDWHKIIDGRKWIVSTRRELIDLAFVNASFDSDQMPWAKPASTAAIQKMIDNSITFGLYTVDENSNSKQNKQIGMARMITDHITFAYLTDVFVTPDYRRYGHARWLLACCRQVIESMPILRRGMLLTGLPYGEAFYKETLDFYNVNEEKDHLICLTGKLTPRPES